MKAHPTAHFRKILIALFMLSFMVTPALTKESKKPSFTPIEKIIYSNHELQKLDGMLNQSYRSAAKVAKDKKKFKDEQIRWLADVRNKCTDTSCFEDVYCDRINTLHDIEVELLNVIGKPLTDSEAKIICNTLAALADKKELSRYAVPGKNQYSLDERDKKAGWGLSSKVLQRIKKGLEEEGACYDCEPDIIYKIKIKPKSNPTIFGRFFTGGSCASFEIYNLDAFINRQEMKDKKKTKTEEDKYSFPDENSVEHYDDSESDGDMHYYAYWGGGDYPIEYYGRYYMVTSDIVNDNNINMISWITPDGSARPLAQFEVKDTHKAVVSADNEILCSGVSRGRMKPVVLKSLKTMSLMDENKENYREEFEKKYEQYAHSLDIYKIDIDGDAKKENVGWFLYESGAGCGATVRWMKVLTSDCNRIAKHPLNDVFSSFNEYRSSLALFEFKGKYYIEGEVDGSIGLFRIEKDKLIKCCGFDQMTKTRMVRYYPLKKN